VRRIAVIDTVESARIAEANSFNGTRKLIRPRLPIERRHDFYSDDPLTHALQETLPNVESSHAEAFYFQKQIQQQTEMTIILEDGEELTGHLEWYDRCVIKLRSGRRRVLIYKAAIKYLYKSSEAQSTEIMK
jgi:host factor-I protein